MASNRAQEGWTETQLADVIRWVRGHKVILDQDLACLYSVEVRALNQAVKRNPNQFRELHVPVDCRRGGISKITICDLRK